MNTKFYESIIANEREKFKVNEAALKKAAADVAKSYNRKALKKGSTYLNYNYAANRCAYLYKYADIHTGLVTKYFENLIEKEEVKNLLESKKNLKICCLGGGPGTDIVGIFRALAKYSAFHEKVSEVRVLDICKGWRNSFKRIISSIKKGKMKGIPENFIDKKRFFAHLISVDLLGALPQGVVNVISNADIICMVKFVSAVLGKPESVSALQNIGKTFKPGTVILFIDNFQGNVSKSLEDISSQIGLEITLGPLHEVFVCRKRKTDKKVYKCIPLPATRVSVVGYVKMLTPLNLMAVNSLPENILKVDNDDGWYPESDEDESFSSSLRPIKPIKSNVRPKDYKSVHKPNNQSHFTRAKNSKRSCTKCNKKELKTNKDETLRKELELLDVSLEKLQIVLKNSERSCIICNKNELKTSKDETLQKELELLVVSLKKLQTIL
ncbi:uncharacterized protein LOC118195940 [Stegodyphus dumicola]|uniref:uncharacterized protein LOC118195940 n=1 Tax=Stegodyphus dumicola TaxID=202533 RepID=UPI0015A9755C|nr:uncharacterized protein LOC118195940 [Stegodyphus dumicola]